MDVDDVSCPEARSSERECGRDTMRESAEKMRKIKMRKGKMKSIKRERGGRGVQE